MADDFPIPVADNDIELRSSAIHGVGVFALRGLPPGHLVGSYEGRRYLPTDGHAALRGGEITYVFGLSDGTLIDGSEGGNATRHINHSCSPNCQACEETDGDGGLHIVIRTRRRIRAGEELFIDYRLDVGADDPTDYPCRCGAANCRGTLAAGGTG